MLGVSEHSNGSNKAFKRSVAKLNLEDKKKYFLLENKIMNFLFQYT